MLKILQTMNSQDAGVVFHSRKQKNVFLSDFTLLCSTQNWPKGTIRFFSLSLKQKTTVQKDHWLAEGHLFCFQTICIILTSLVCFGIHDKRFYTLCLKLRAIQPQIKNFRYHHAFLLFFSKPKLILCQCGRILKKPFLK